MIDLERVREELIESLPAEPKWAEWVDGVIGRLAPDGSEHGAPFELVIPCQSEAEALSEKLDLHVAAEARAVIRRLR